MTFNLANILTKINGARKATSVEIFHHTRQETGTIHIWTGGGSTPSPLPEIGEMPIECWTPPERSS